MATTQNPGSQLNYEELGAEVAKLNPSEVQQAATRLTAPGAAAINISQVCDVYKKVKPFLLLILRIPFIPAPIKTAITAFTNVMNTLCP